MKYRILESKYQGVCDSCQSEIRVGEKMAWNPDRNARLRRLCLVCHADEEERLEEDAAERMGMKNYVD